MNKNDERFIVLEFIVENEFYTKTDIGMAKNIPLFDYVSLLNKPEIYVLNLLKDMVNDGLIKEYMYEGNLYWIYTLEGIDIVYKENDTEWYDIFVKKLIGKVKGTPYEDKVRILNLHMGEVINFFGIGDDTYKNFNGNMIFEEFKQCVEDFYEIRKNNNQENKK